MSDHKLQEIVTKSKNLLQSLKPILQQAQQKMGFQFGALGVPKETISFFDIICMHFVWLGMGLHAMMLVMLSSNPLHCHWSELNFTFLMKNTIANFFF